MKKSLMLSMFMVLSLIAVGCFEDGDDGATGSSGAPGQDALISYYSYEFTATTNPSTWSLPVIDIDGVEAGWQTVTVWLWADPSWMELPFTMGDGSTSEIDYTADVREGGVQVIVIENAVINDPPTVGYQDYMVIVQTFNH